MRSNQTLVHCLSCQALRRIAYLNFCNGCMFKGLGLGLGTYGLGLEGPGHGLKNLVLTTSLNAILIGTSAHHTQRYKFK